MCKADMKHFTDTGLLSLKNDYETLLHDFDPADYNNKLTEARLREEYNLILLEIHKRQLHKTTNNTTNIIMLDLRRLTRILK